MLHAITSKYVAVGDFMAGLEKKGVPRVPGTAVFLTRSKRGVPPVMAWHVKHNRALHEKLMVINVCIEPIPWVEAADRLHFFQEAPNFWRATANFGFMERPDIPALLLEAKGRGCDISGEDVTYYVGRETVVSREDGTGLPECAESPVRRHGAQRCACDRLLPAAAGSGRRDRPGSRFEAGPGLGWLAE